ncbi:MAG: hypothetical protein V4773_24340 [Verrucomicrobiota bacterium]
MFGKTRTLRIFGAQDYMVIVEGGIPSDAGGELNALTNPLLREHGYFGVLCIEEPGVEVGIHIHPIFSGNWSFAICPSVEDAAMPAWPIRRSWGSVNAHSETLEIEVPKTATLRVLPPVESEPKPGA